MEVTVLDMRRNPKRILDAIAQGETVSLTNRGKHVANIEPVAQRQRMDAGKHKAFGMWADREDMSDPAAYVRNMRKGRFDDL